eukprot:3334526-Prymnesium_polylepis.2
MEFTWDKKAETFHRYQYMIKPEAKGPGYTYTITEDTKTWKEQPEKPPAAFILGDTDGTRRSSTHTCHRPALLRLSMPGVLRVRCSLGCLPALTVGCRPLAPTSGRDQRVQQDPDQGDDNVGGRRHDAVHHRQLDRQAHVHAQVGHRRQVRRALPLRRRVLHGANLQEDHRQEIGAHPSFPERRAVRWDSGRLSARRARAVAQSAWCRR